MFFSLEFCIKGSHLGDFTHTTHLQCTPRFNVDDV